MRISHQISYENRTCALVSEYYRFSFFLGRKRVFFYKFPQRVSENGIQIIERCQEMQIHTYVQSQNTFIYVYTYIYPSIYPSIWRPITFGWWEPSSCPGWWAPSRCPKTCSLPPWMTCIYRNCLCFIESYHKVYN